MASNNTAAAEAAEEVLNKARTSQRLSSTRTDPRKFTLNREAAKRMRDAAIADALGRWLTVELGTQVRGEDPDLFAEDLESGVVFCQLAAKFGQITRFKDPPANEFQRLENFELFTRSMKRFGLCSQMPPSKRGAQFSQYLPCLLELAVLAKNHSVRMDMDSTVPDDLIDQAEASANQPTEESAPADKHVVRIDDIDKELAEEDDDAQAQSQEEGMNRLLGQLHLERMQRQRAGPPKLRLVDVGGRQLVSIERPGESMGSVVSAASVALVNFLHSGPFRGEIFSTSSNGGTILELGSGCGLCGIWCASEGMDVVVTDLPTSVDLLWANVAANAQQVVKGGGSCSARAMDFSDHAQVQKLCRNLDSPLTVVAADVVHGEAVRPLIACLQQIFQEKPAKVFVAYKERDTLHEETFFLALGEYKEVASLPDCKIYCIQSMK